jgi:hypothetical protein
MFKVNAIDGPAASGKEQLWPAYALHDGSSII